MIPSYVSHLELLRSHLVPGLCSPDCYTDIAAIAEHLPMTVSSGFERTMGDARGLLDFALAFRRSQPGGRHLFEHSSVAPPMRALLRSALDRDSPLFQAFDTFWFEYDTSRGCREPSFFVGLDRQHGIEHALMASEIVLGRTLAPAVIREVNRIAAPAPGVRLFQVGWMLARSRPGLRLCLSAFESEGLRTLIDRVATGAARDALLDRHARLGDCANEFAIGVDVGEGEVSPRIGLEFGMQGWKPSQPVHAWAEMLLRLDHDGLCSGRERMALLRWPGCMTEQTCKEDWPAHLRGAGALLGPYEARFERAIHHIKVLVDGSEVTRAKVYFGSLQSWGVRR